MKYTNLGEFTKINPYVEAKLRRLHAMEPGFSSLYSLMFSEGDNILFERSVGFRIEKTTYAQARARIERLSGGFSGLCRTLPAGSVVGLHMDNGPEWIIAFWMILKCGFRPLLMNLRLSDALLAEAMAACDARCVVSDGKRFDVPTILFNDIPEAQPSAVPFGTEVLLMSSGTTEHLKVCAYSAHEFTHQIEDSYHIIRQCRAIKRHYRGELKLLTFLPFYHIFGLVAVYIWFAFFSRTFVALNDLAPQTILNTIRRHGVTHIFAVPLFWNRVYDGAIKTAARRGAEEKLRRGLRIAQRICDLPLLGDAFCRIAFREVRENLFGPSVRFMITGGSEIRSEVLCFFNCIGYPLANGYGLTEAGITSVELSPKKHIRSLGFVGRPLSSVEYRRSDTGELLLRGCSTAKYILADGKRLESGDWFPTHDLAECVHGHWRILGRSDDLVISPGGENLNPCLLEPQLAVDGAKELCLVGTAEHNGIVPTVLVRVDRHITAAQAENLLAALRSRTARLVPDARILLTAEPLTGPDEIKLNRGRLARALHSGTIALIDPAAVPTGAALPDDALMDELREIFAFALGRDAGDITPDADFFLDAGGTSLDYFAMLSRLQQDYGIDFPASDRSLNTLRELYDYMKAVIHD